MEIDLTVLLNLKCGELQEIGTPILAETKDKFQIRNTPKGVEFNFISIHVNFIRSIFIISCYEPLLQ